VYSGAEDRRVGSLSFILLSANLARLDIHFRKSIDDCRLGDNSSRRIAWEARLFSISKVFDDTKVRAVLRRLRGAAFAQ